MLNFIKKHISVYMFLVVFIILFVFIVLDIQLLYQQKCQKYQEPMGNIVEVQELYAQIYTAVQENCEENISSTEKTDVVDKVNIFRSNPWRIQIPKLKVDAPITEGTSTESLRRTVGHFEETDIWKGNVALAGHNRGYRCNFFQEIKDLEKGDMIIYCTEKGKRKYKVVINTVIEETDWSYIQNTKDNRITLITCESNKREYRRCIQAIEIEENMGNVFER